MKQVTIWHNPRCSKSRNTLALLEENDLEVEVVKYLDAVPTKSELVAILKMLGMSARELMRTKEEIYKTLQLQDVSDEDALIEAMLSNPKLIERPIVIYNGQAAIGRPIENVVALLK